MSVWLRQLWSSLHKEVRVLLRDKEAVLVLIAMPAVFVLIMSLALQDTFRARSGHRLTLVIVNQDRGFVGQALTAALLQEPYLEVRRQSPTATGGTADLGRLRAKVAAGHNQFLLLIPPGATQEARARLRALLSAAPAPRPVPVPLFVDPALPVQNRAVVQAGVRRALQGVETTLLLQALGGPRVQSKGPHASAAAAPLLALQAHSGAGPGAPAPTSVQQNAPAWTLLAMFFLVIPLSVTLIKERQQGCMQRIRSLPVPAWIVLAGKILPYFIINEIQVLVVLLEGIYLLPVLGGDALSIGHSPGGILLVSVAANLAAIGYGLLVATFVRTQEQATTFGAVSVLIMGAIGGVMVPKLVMPETMQRLANISPLSWGLDGFQEIFVRGGHVVDVLPRVLDLLVFAAICLAAAIARFRRELGPQ